MDNAAPSGRPYVPLPVQGIRCPQCHCRDTRVYGTKRKGSRIIRYRACRHCGYAPIVTYEERAAVDTAHHPG